MKLPFTAPRTWEVLSFGEIVADSAFGPRFSGECYATDGNVATLRTTDLDDYGRISYETMPLARLQYDKFEQHFLQSGDLVISRSGTCGITALFDRFPVPVLPGAFLIRFRLAAIADPRFYFYFLNSPIGRSHVLSVATGAVQQNLNITNLERLFVPVPPLSEQRAIVSILSAYDDLIENNIRGIKILEEMAQMIYREWFVNFRFPGHEKVEMVKSGTGRIPKGWETCSVTEVIDVNPVTKVSKDGMKPFVSMGALSENCMLVGEVEEREGNSGSKFQNGDTLFARITPCLENGKTGFVQFLPSSDSVAFGSTEFIVLRSRAVCPEYVYLMARSNEFRENAIKSMSGATGRQRVQERCFEKFTIAKPPSETLLQFLNTVQPMFKLVQVMNQENVNLRRTRDLLLPKLISGEISVEHFKTENASQTS